MSKWLFCCSSISAPFYSSGVSNSSRLTPKNSATRCKVSMSGRLVRS
nr:MAG TPA: hypothetical protein [Caudoviricetes sp.]